MERGFAMSLPDRWQALKASACAPPLRGFGVDRLPTARLLCRKPPMVEKRTGHSLSKPRGERAALVRSGVQMGCSIRS
jgi:hypothetical protein